MRGIHLAFPSGVWRDSPAAGDAGDAGDPGVVLSQMPRPRLKCIVDGRDPLKSGCNDFSGSFCDAFETNPLGRFKFDLFQND